MITKTMTLKARCKDGHVEVFVVGKWRFMLNCRKTTTEITNKRRLTAMANTIMINTGMDRDPRTMGMKFVFEWVK